MEGEKVQGKTELKDGPSHVQARSRLSKGRVISSDLKTHRIEKKWG